MLPSMNTYLFPSLFSLALCVVFVWLAVRRMRAGKLPPCLFVATQPFNASRITSGNKKPPAFPNVDGQRKIKKRIYL